MITVIERTEKVSQAGSQLSNGWLDCGQLGIDVK